jgi:hypothetical protein
MTFKAHIRNGRIVLDAPTTLPEGAEIELMPVHSFDNLDDEDRRKLDEALAESDEDVSAGRVESARKVLSELRRR